MVGYGYRSYFILERISNSTYDCFHLAKKANHTDSSAEKTQFTKNRFPFGAFKADDTVARQEIFSAKGEGIIRKLLMSRIFSET